MNKNISFTTLAGLKSREQGLTPTEVQSQAQRFGWNEIIERSGNPWLELAWDTLKDPMIWFLAGIGSLFVSIGDTQEGLILFVAILPLVLMDFVLHWRTQASTESLKSQLATSTFVLREGKEIEVESKDLVPGDIVLLSAVQNPYLPADGIFESADRLQIDESVLTGEAFPISKQASKLDFFSQTSSEQMSVPSENLGFAGTRVLVGSGRLRVLSTGKYTSYGEIVRSVSSLPRERTELQQAIGNLVRNLTLAAAVFCLILAAVRLYQGHGWLDAIVSAATLAVAAIPEEFPVVFTFFLGVGVYRLARRKALVIRAVSVENIGRISRICTDKTGTVTIGQLTLAHLQPGPEVSELELLETAMLASDAQGIDPVDQAIVSVAKERGIQRASRGHVFPFTEDRKRESALAQNTHGQWACHSKGAPETILLKCDLSLEAREQWLKKTSELALGGHKVLACAFKTISTEEAQLQLEPESGFRFSGLLAFEDPPRPEVRGAIQEARQNGIQTLMITGDHPQTAIAIAKDIGLGGELPNVVSAEEFPERFRSDWLTQNFQFLQKVDVVARCNPLQKFHIVNAFKNTGEVIAVTGDGVNDVPALKAADIGIAMGLRGTRSAKEVSSIILADDNFSTIVNAIREGRQLFSNLKASFEYLLLFHIPFVLTAALIPLLGYPLLYLPIHIVWLELIIHPSALFAFQQPANEKKFVGPRREKSFFNKMEAFRILILGMALTVLLLFIYQAGLKENLQVEHARAKALALMILWSAVLVSLLTQGKTVFARLVIILTVLSGILFIQVEPISRSLHLSPLHLSDWLSITLAVGFFGLILWIWRNWRRSSQ